MTIAGTSKAAASPDDKPNKEDTVPSIDAAVQGRLGQKLRETYRQIVNEPVPDRFLELLAELKENEAKKKPEVDT